MDGARRLLWVYGEFLEQANANARSSKNGAVCFLVEGEPEKEDGTDLRFHFDLFLPARV